MKIYVHCRQSYDDVNGYRHHGQMCRLLVTFLGQMPHYSHVSL